MFPIANEQGKPIAFTGRALDSTDVDAKAGPKYFNSPETLLYTKGNVLFNLDKAKAAMKKDDVALLVEGQMDCISVFMGGIHGVIATSGTAFTETQVRTLARFTKNVVLNFDPDDAGAIATEKTISLLVEEGFQVRVVTLPGGLDPDRYIKERGIADYSAAVRGATRYADYLIERARTLFPARTPEAKVKAMNFLLPHIRLVPNALLRTEFATNAAQKLGIDNAMMLQELKQAAQQRLESVRAVRPGAMTEVERILLRALLLPDADSMRALAVERLSLTPDWYAELPSAPAIEVLVNAPAPENPFDAAPDGASRELLAAAMQGEAEQTSDAVLGALETLHDRYLDRRLRELTTQIAEAERRGDEAMRLRLLQEQMRLNRERQR
jgi:DNA primase